MKFCLNLYLALPAFVANMLPVVASKIGFWPKLDFPVDGAKTMFGRRIFGANKSWRGLVVGVLGGALVGAIQFMLFKFGIIAITDLQNLPEFIAFGALAGLGALLGDLAGSWLKRLFKIAPGRPFLPLDQIDYIVGFFIFTAILIDWSLVAVISLLVFVAVANPLVNAAAYFLGIKKTFW
ncbi:MAG: CDP-archaeol synthase [Candidatus Peribacteraceae bacterium]|nr:CDP-archaeol synthase [Candidatus Peribacteraceae bacterium]